MGNFLEKVSLKLPSKTFLLGKFFVFIDAVLLIVHNRLCSFTDFKEKNRRTLRTDGFGCGGGGFVYTVFCGVKKAISSGGVILLSFFFV